MPDVLDIMGTTRVLVCAAEGPILSGEGDVNDFLTQAWAVEADWTAVPTSRLADDFLVLSTRKAGEAIQKFTTYRQHLAIVGDISAATARSSALRDYVREANRGAQVWFVDDLDGLRRRLGDQPRPGSISSA